jgi:hypothetical protein
MATENTLRKIVGTGLTLTALALAGCAANPEQNFKGVVEGNQVTITRNLDSKARRIIIKDGTAPTSWRIPSYLIGYDEGNLTFNDIRLDGADVNRLERDFQNPLRSSPLSRYAHKDSLERMYNAVLAQNGSSQ